MKVCQYCKTENRDDALQCVTCAANQFDTKCNQCGTIFNAAYCPTCGVKAGQTARHCEACGTDFFSAACPECGWKPGAPQRAQVQPAQPAQIIVDSAACPKCGGRLTLQTKLEKKKRGWFSIVLLVLGCLYTFCLILLIPAVRKRKMVLATWSVCPNCGYKHRHELETKVDMKELTRA